MWRIWAARRNKVWRALAVVALLTVPLILVAITQSGLHAEARSARLDTQCWARRALHPYLAGSAGARIEPAVTFYAAATPSACPVQDVGMTCSTVHGVARQRTACVALAGMPW